MLKNSLSFYLVIIIISLITNSVKATEKIAFIDLNAIFDNSAAGKKINSQVKEKQKKINVSLKKFQETFKSDREKLKTQKNVLSEEEYKKKFMELEKNFNEYNSIINKKNLDLKNFKTKVRVEFSKNLNNILEDYSKKNSISMILKKENILIGKTNLDATREVLDLFNNNIKKISVK